MYTLQHLMTLTEEYWKFNMMGSLAGTSLATLVTWLDNTTLADCNSLPASLELLHSKIQIVYF